MTASEHIRFVIVNTQQLEPGLAATCSFDNGGGSIGASDNNNWVLRDRKNSVHDTHCFIDFFDHQFCLTDNSDACYINGASMPVGRGQRVRLNENDQLTLGEYQVRVYLQEDSPRHHASQTLEQLMLSRESADTLHDDKPPQGDGSVSRPETQEIDDPLAALDELELAIASQNHQQDSELEEELQQQHEHHLLARDKVWQGDEVTSQADSEDDADSAIMLKSATHKRQRVAEENTDHSHQTGHYNQHQTGRYNQPASQKGFYMDEEILDQLEAEVARGIAQEVPEPDWNDADLKEGGVPLSHLATSPMMKGMGISLGDQEDMGQMQALSEEMGASLKAAIEGLLSLHRQVDEGRYGVMNRNLQPIEDNPLRLQMDYGETVKTLFDGDRSPVHLSAPAAINESLTGVRHHNEAVQSATSEALSQVLKAFSPDVLMRRFQHYRRPGQGRLHSPDAWAWQMYQSYYQELISSRQQGFEKLFWEIFDQAYDRKLRALQQEEA